MSPLREDVGSSVLLTQSAIDSRWSWPRWQLGWQPEEVNHPTLSTNEAWSKRRLEQLIRKLQRYGQYKEYDSIIQEQLQEGVVEPAPEVATGIEFYIPHKALTRENAESTKLRIVYDSSAREKENQPSLNDCLNPGPPLTNRLVGHPYKVQILPCTAHWWPQEGVSSSPNKERRERFPPLPLETPKQQKNLFPIRSTRALFGMTCLPFPLGRSD